MDQVGGRRRDTRAVLHAVPVGIIALDDTGLIRDTNPAAASLLGRPVDALLGVDLRAMLHRHDADERIIRPDGTAVRVRLRLEPLVEDGVVIGSVVTMNPVAESADSTGSASRDRFLAELERALQPLEDPDEIMATVAQLLGEHMQVDRSAYAEAEADEDHFTMTGSYARGLPELTGRMAMSDFSADTLRCMREGVPYVLADAENDPRVLPEQRGIYHHTGIVAVICVPLHKAGRFVAAMAVHQRTPRVWTAAEIDLLTTVVGRCWESLQRAHALAAVRESEERFRLLVERATDAIWLADDGRRYVDVNPAACALLGYSREEHLMLGVGDVVRPEDIPRLNELLTVLADGASVTEVWELRRRDGSAVPVELSMSSAAHGRVQAIGRDITQRRRAESERERLFRREQEANRQLQLLQQTTAALSRATTPAEVADVVLDHAAGLGAESAVLMLREGPHLQPIAARGPVAATLPAVALDAPDPLASAVRTARAVWSGSPVAVPLILSDRAIGVVGMWVAAEHGGTPELAEDQRDTVLTVAGQCAQALDRARLHQAEHEVADVLQRSLLPRELPALARLAAAARYTPAAEHALSGGDWYDLLPLGGTRVALVVGDVVGHGPGAAAVMGQLRSALATHLLEGHSPAAALERLDRFAAQLGGSTGSTCACLTLDWSTGELRWAMAGHPPMLLVDGDEARFLDGGAGAVLGLRGRAPYQEAGTVVAPGSSVVLYTDGLVERRHEVVDTGLDRLRQVARRLGDRGPADLVRGVVDAVLDETGPADDVALLVVRAVPAPLHGRLPAAATSMSPLRSAVSDWAAAAGLPEESAEDLELAIGEAAANAAEHAYPGGGGEFDYSLARTDDGAVDVRVRDHGRWRPVPADNGHRGHGLRVIGELVDGFVIDRGPDGTEARFRLHAAAPASDSDPGGIAAQRRSRTRAPVEASVEPRQGPAGERVLAVHGDLDLAGRDIVGPALLTSAGIAGPLVVDLTGVGYLSSAGVALLAEASAAAGPALSILLIPGSAPARVLQLTGLAAVLPAGSPDGAALH